MLQPVSCGGLASEAWLREGGTGRVLAMVLVLVWEIVTLLSSHLFVRECCILATEPLPCVCKTMSLLISVAEIDR